MPYWLKIVCTIFGLLIIPVATKEDGLNILSFYDVLFYSLQIIVSVSFVLGFLIDSVFFRLTFIK